MFTYSFNWKDDAAYEAGEITATRYSGNVCVGGDWVCQAKDDKDALRKAKRAAYNQWVAPDTRHHLDFTVEFFDAVSAPSSVDVTCSFFDEGGVNVWPTHEQFVVRGATLESALAAVQSLLELECRGLSRCDDYAVGDKVLAYVWEPSGRLHVLTHTLTSEDVTGAE